MDGLRARGLIDTEDHFTDAGREVKHRIEALTDELATPPYEALSPAELDALITELEPITAARHCRPQAHSERQQPTRRG